MKRKKIEHIFFDLDHTLWDFDKNSKMAFEKMFQKSNISIAVEDFMSVYQPINRSYWKLYREEKVTKEALRRGRLIDTFKAFDMRLSLVDIDLLSSDYIDFLPLTNYLIDGAIDLLEYLAPKYQLHIITNGFTEVQHKKLENANIRNYFMTITDSELVGVKKPNPIIFEHAIRVSSATIDTSIMIGDNYEADIIGADSLGIRSICFNYHRETLPNTIVQVLELKHIKEML